MFEPEGPGGPWGREGPDDRLLQSKSRSKTRYVHIRVGEGRLG